MEIVNWLSALVLWGLGRVLYSRRLWYLGTLLALALLVKVILDVAQGGRICDW
jgi:hypothetical protein